MLTGDKQETAIEIGKSCKLIQDDMVTEILSSNSQDEFKEKLLEMTRKWKISNDSKINLAKIEDDMIGKPRIAIVIDGPTLTWALSEEATANVFFRFGLLASSVICCRVSPK